MSRPVRFPPFSILFQDPSADLELESVSEPDFFPDLKLGQVFAAITSGRDEYRLGPFFRRALSTESEISYRQDVFRDLESGLEVDIEGFAESMRRVRSHLRGSEERHHAYAKASWFLDAGQIYCQAVEGLEVALAAAKPTSRGFGACIQYLRSYLGSPEFQVLKEVTQKIKSGLGAIRYNARVRGNRVVVSSYQGEADYSTEVLETFGKFQQGDAESRLVHYPPEFTNHIQERIVDLIARLHPDLFGAMAAYPGTFAHFVDPVVARLDREVQFYLGYLELVHRLQAAGLSFCYPRVSSQSKEVAVTSTFDLALAAKLVGEDQAVVTNDFRLELGERIFVVSGPNQGGKTTFARTFAQLHHLGTLGCPVPGTRARLFLCDRIFTHFERQEQVEDLQSKLENELLRVRQILEQATGSSLVVLNETLASTTVEDAKVLGREVLERLIELDLLAVYVTFIHELSRLGPSLVSMVSTVVPDNPAERTFRVVRQPADGRAYAAAIARRHGLTYEVIRERIRR